MKAILIQNFRMTNPSAFGCKTGVCECGCSYYQKFDDSNNKFECLRCDKVYTRKVFLYE